MSAVVSLRQTRCVCLTQQGAFPSRRMPHSTAPSTVLLERKRGLSTRAWAPVLSLSRWPKGLAQHGAALRGRTSSTVSLTSSADLHAYPFRGLTFIDVARRNRALLISTGPWISPVAPYLFVAVQFLGPFAERRVSVGVRHGRA